MQELRLVAVSEDGTYLVLATAGRGTRFTLPVDDRLRAAVRGHFSRLGQFEIEVESPLRPKEIQARIRAGETAEEIAESAGIPVERVRWFEGPVLQEREYMAQQAQRVTVRRQGESSPGPPLGEMVEERLGRRGVDLEDIEWDSRKCEDNTWRIRLAFFDDGRPHAAEWTFDPRRRHISPLDEEAARLSSLVLDESVADTVTPLVPRRPAMKVVSEPRALPDPRRERPLEPRRDQAEPRRDYIVERGRMVEPRPQPLAPPPREPAALPPSYGRPDERRREHGSARGPAAFAPLPPAREIAIPPIDVEMEVEVEVTDRPSGTRPETASGSRPAPVEPVAYQAAPQAPSAADARAAEPDTDIGTGTGQETGTAPVTVADSDAETVADADSETVSDTEAGTVAAQAPVHAARPADPGAEPERAAEPVTESASGTDDDARREDARRETEAQPVAAPPQETASAARPRADGESGVSGESGTSAAEIPETPETPEVTEVAEVTQVAQVAQVAESGTSADDTAASGTDERTVAERGPEETDPVRTVSEQSTPDHGTADHDTTDRDRTESESESESGSEDGARTRPAAAREPVAEPAASATPEPAQEPATTQEPVPEPAAEPAPKPAVKPAAKPAAAKPAPAAPPATRARPRPERGRRSEPAERVAQPAAVEEQPAKPAAAAVNGDAAPKPAPRGRRKGSARGKRASVPSWDEIMFGARRPD